MIKNILFILVIVVLWLAFVHKEKQPENTFEPFDDASQESFFPAFECAGKKSCSEMVSCEEAKYYMSSCPGANLDPDGDGVPCEQLCSGQWK